MSALSEAIHRVEGSALAVLKMLRDSKGALSEIDEEDDDGDLVVVKAGGSTVVSTTIAKKSDMTSEQNIDSIVDEITAVGEMNKDGIIRVGSEADDLSVQSELTMFDDLKPLSLTSIRRAGVAILACLVASIYNAPDAKSRAGPIKAFVTGGGMDALIVGSFYEWRGEDGQDK
jgi:hypothetical protein